MDISITNFILKSHFIKETTIFTDEFTAKKNMIISCILNKTNVYKEGHS